MKVLYIGTYNYIIEKFRDDFKISLPMNDNIYNVSEVNKFSFFVYDTSTGTVNGMKITDKALNIRDSILNEYSFQTRWYNSVNFDKSYTNLYNIIKNGFDKHYLHIKCNEASIYYYEYILKSLNVKGITVLNNVKINHMNHGYDVSALISNIENESTLDKEIKLECIKNLVEHFKQVVEDFFTKKHDFSKVTEANFCNVLTNDVEICLSYLAQILSSLNYNLVDEEKIKEYINKYYIIEDSYFDEYKKNNPSIKDFRKLLGYHYTRNFYCSSKNVYQKIINCMILNNHMYLLLKKGVNKQTLSNFANNCISIAEESVLSEYLTYGKIVGEKVSGVLKRNQATISRNIFCVCKRYMKDHIDWNQIDINILSKYFSDNEIASLGVKKEIRKPKYYDEIIKNISSSAYPYREFASLVILINELDNAEFKEYTDIICSELYNFISTEITKNDSYTYGRTYASYFNLLKEDDKFRNKKNAEELFLALYSNAKNLNTTMKKKLTIFTLQCGLESSSTNHPEDFKKYSLELKMRK